MGTGDPSMGVGCEGPRAARSVQEDLSQIYHFRTPDFRRLAAVDKVCQDRAPYLKGANGAFQSCYLSRALLLLLSLSLTKTKNLKFFSSALPPAPGIGTMGTADPNMGVGYEVARG